MWLFGCTLSIFPRLFFVVAVAMLFGSTAMAQNPTLPELQQQYVNRKLGMFIHFNMGTFTGEDWASPNRPLSTFNPTALNTDQWANAAVSAGMKYGVFTSKHHDGFALWDSSRSTYDVFSTPWAAGQAAAQRDIVQRYVNSFRSRGLAVGIYYSIWDRTNNLQAGGIPAAQATQYVKDELSQLLSNYGQIDIIWTDGWGWAEDSKLGPDPYAYVDFNQVYQHIKTLSPTTILVENNYDTDLSHTDIRAFESVARYTVPPGNTLPAEVADTIRANNRWFWTSGGGVKTTASLVDTQRMVNSRNAAYLLNVSPDTRGLIPDDQVARLAEIGRVNKPDNLARRPGASASQSSTYPLFGGPFHASFATDGLLVGNATNKFSHTNTNDFAPWWEVDLGGSFLVGEVDIFNRLDGWKGRLRDLTVTILDAQRNVVFTSNLLNPQNILGGGRTQITNGPDVLYLDIPQGAFGRFVRISRARDTTLSGEDGYVLAMAEVQVRAVPEPVGLVTLGALAGVGLLRRRRDQREKEVATPLH